MKINPAPLLVFIAVSVMVFTDGCAVFEEKPLTNTPVRFTSPSNLSTVTSLNLSFVWTKVTSDSPFQYNLNISKLDRNNNRLLITDTNTTHTSYSKKLDPGPYQALIYAYNGHSQSPKDSVLFVIDTASTVGATGTTLIAPVDNQYITTQLIIFQWNTIPYATAYRLQIAATNFTSDNNILVDRLVGNQDTVTVKLVSDGVYQWRIFAKNSISESQASSARSFTLITKTPSTPVLLAPINNFTSTSGFVSFQWSKDADTNDSLFVYKQDSTTYVTGFPYYRNYPSSAGSYDFALPSGLYFWKVRAADKAGNVSGYSERRKFTIP